MKTTEIACSAKGRSSLSSSNFEIQDLGRRWLSLNFFPWRPRSALAVVVVSLWTLLAAAQTGSSTPPIGRLLSSDTVAIEGRTSWASSKEDLEDPTPLVFSGNKITMQAGIALLQMEDSSGVVGFCGRTSLSIMKSKSSTLYAVNSGTLSFDLASSTLERVITPEMAVEWNSVGAGRKQGVVSLDSRGVLCVQNFEGSVKLIDLLNGQSLQLPAGSSVEVQSGQASTARLSKNLDCGCTKLVPLGSAATPFAAGQSGPATQGTAPAAAPRISKVAPARENLPSALTTVTDENSRPPQPPGNTDRQQARSVERLDLRVSPPVASPAPASPPPAQNNPPASAATGEKDPPEAAPVLSATMAASAESLPKPAERKKTFGQKVKNFFSTIFFMKKKHPASSSSSN
jgi:hypothetical protein